LTFPSHNKSGSHNITERGDNHQYPYARRKEKSTYGAEPNKLYGTFASSSEKKTEPENTPAISLNVNEFENKPLFPPQKLMSPIPNSNDFIMLRFPDTP
jgi:hypothetical protein